jgi:hypothetical protein
MIFKNIGFYRSGMSILLSFSLTNRFGAGQRKTRALGVQKKMRSIDKSHVMVSIC